MVNKTQFYKTKVALAVVVSLGLTACGGGDDSTANSNSVADTVTEAVDNTLEQAQGTGSVQGTVLDTNGLPVMGATVSLAGQAVETDASGYYHFTDVPVSGVSGSNVVNAASAYLVTITAPAGYASAVVTVTANNIQIDSGNNGTNANANQVESSAEQTTWFDGFLAQAATAVLPKNAASVTGVLRNCTTGAAVAGATVALDFTAISTTVTANVSGTAANVSIGVPVFTATSAADGSFTFTEIPTDSTFGLVVENYSLDGTNAVESTGTQLEAVTTTAEGVVNNLGTQSVCMITSEDETNPYIDSVAGSIGTTSASTASYEYEVLGKGIDGTAGITLNFNEPIDAAGFDAEDVVVTLAANAADTTQTIAEIATNTDGSANVVLSADGMSLTVVLADAIADEQRFSIWFPKWQYKDTSGNELVTGDDEDSAGAIENLDLVQDENLLDSLAGDGDGSDEFGILSDMISQETGKIGYVRTRLCTYIAPAETPEGLTGEQLVKTLDSSLLAVSPLWDNSGDTVNTTTSNLNGQENATAGRDTGERLQTRFTGQTVINDRAEIVGSVQNASGITATVVAGTGAASFTYNVPAIAADGSYSITADNTVHGTEVTLTPTGAFGVSGTPVTVTLEDKVAPTTILQENYELWAVEADYSATTLTAGTGASGSGGEVSEGSISGADGDPIIYIQPRHLSPTTNNLSDRYEEFDAFAFTSKLVDGANDNSLYSGPGFSGWTTRGNSVGVAFSETIATGSVAPLESASVTVALTGVLNGLTTDIDGNTIVGQPDTANGGVTAIPNTGEDLARFTVSDMIDFANNDHNEAIDFTNGSIVDTQGNLANANSDARVVIRDAMPAFVTAARWDGSNIIINFNETIVPDGTGIDADVLILKDLDFANTATPDFSLTLSDTAVFPAQGAYSLNAAGDELTVAVDASNVSTLFQNGPADVYVFDSNGDNTVENHLALDFDTITDTNGNSWFTFDRDKNAALTVDSDATPGDDRVGRYTVDAPRFMVYNDVGIFTITKQTIGYSDTDVVPNGDDNGIVTVRFSFSHPIDLLDDNDSVSPGDQRSDMRVALDNAQVPDYNGSLTLTPAQINSIFQMSLLGNAATTGDHGNFATGASFAGSFSADYKVVSITMHEAADAINAGTTRIDFWDVLAGPSAALQVDSSITDEFLAAENYTVVNSN